MRHLITLFCFLSLQQFAFGQDIFKKNEIFLELGGNGLLGSVNYSRQLTNKPALELRVGLGAYGSDPKTYVTVPVALNYIINVGGKHGFLNVGIGGTYTKADVRLGILIDYAEGYEKTRSQPVNMVANVGYRYYTSGDFSFRVNFTPVINRHGLLPLLGLSVGKRF
ncbi:MAG: hypothetical protein V4687_16905 [Bacteroidota bacterium]